MSIYRSAEGERQVRRWCEQRLTSWDHPHTVAEHATSLGQTHVLTAGAGPVLVLLAGTNFAAATWLELVARLSAQHTVHAVDLPGQPGLSAPERPRSARRRYGAWLVELLASLGAGPASRSPEGGGPSELPPTLVGHSLGGAVALSGALAGAAVGRLLLIDPAGLLRLRVSAAVLRPTLPWLRRPDRRTSAALLQMMMAPGHTPPDELVTWMTLVGRHVRTSLAPSPIPPRELRALHGTPVDVLTGRHDAFLPATPLRRAVDRRLERATFAVVDEAGHLLPHEQPDAVAERLARLEASDDG